MAENIAEYLLRIAVDTSGTVKFNQSIKEMEKELKKTGQIQKDATLVGFKHTQSMKDGKTVMDKLSVSIRGVNGNLSKKNASLKVNAKSMHNVTNTVSDMSKAHLNLGQDLARVASRALKTVIVWSALRMGMQKVGQAMKFVITNLLELEKGMRKVMAVATFTNKNQEKIYGDLEKAARGYFVTSSKGFAEITEAMYQLGTAGRSTEEILQGFEHILNLSIGTFGNVAQSGKLVSGILNVFDKQLQSIGSTSSRIQYITDLLADAWKNNQIELSEMATSMSFLGSVGGALNIDLKDLIAAASVMSDAMLRGGKGGRLLATALIKVSKESSKLRDLGVVFNPRAPLDFKDVMGQIAELYEEQGSSLSFVKDLTEVFGIRGGRAVLNLVQMWEKFNKEIARTPAQIRGVAEEMKESAEKTLPVQSGKFFRRFWENLAPKGGPSGLTKVLIEANAPAEKLEKTLSKISRVLDTFGASLINSEKDARKLRDALFVLGKIDLANKITAQFGLPGFEGLPRLGLKERGFEDITKDLIKAGDDLEDMGLASAFVKALEEQLKTTKDIKKETEEIVSIRRMGLNTIVSWSKEGKKINEITNDELQVVKDALGFENVRLQLFREVIKFRLEGLKAEIDVNDKLSKQEKVKLKNIQREFELKKMIILGATKEEQIRKKISNFLEKEGIDLKKTDTLLKGNNEELAKAQLVGKKLKDFQKLKNALILEEIGRTRDLTKKEEERLAIDTKLAILKAQGKLDAIELLMVEHQLIDASKTLFDDSKKLIKLRKIETKIMVENINRAREFSDTLEEAFSQGLSDVIMGKSDFKDFGTKLSETITQAWSDAFSEAATKEIFDFTGLGDAFGAMGVNIADVFKTGPEKIKSAYDYGGDVTYKSIIKGFDDAAAGKGVGGAKKEGGIFQSLGMAKQLLPLRDKLGLGKLGDAIGNKIAPKGGFLDKLKGGAQGISNFLKKGRDLSKFGLGTGSLTGRATGAMSLANLYKLKGTGNVFGGATQGAMAGAAVGGPIGAVLGGLYGLFRGGQSKTTSETKTQTLKITSQIQHTNNSLQIVNRNLVALKSTFETFVLPESAAFGEKRGIIEDDFSLSSRR